MGLFKEIDGKEEIYNKIGESFNIKSVIIGNLMFGDNIPVIFIQFNDLNDLEKFWKEFNSFMTAEYLIKLKNEFSKWNSYVFYLSESIIEKPLKYEIENNKFSTRKIIIESINTTIDTSILENILSEHIINDNIEFKVESQEIDSFSKNEAIELALESTSFNKTNDIKEENLLKVLDHLEKTISDEN